MPVRTFVRCFGTEVQVRYAKNNENIPQVIHLGSFDSSLQSSDRGVVATGFAARFRSEVSVSPPSSPRLGRGAPIRNDC